MSKLNQNLLSREKLEQIIEEKEKQIQKLERSNRLSHADNSLVWVFAFMLIGVPTSLALLDISNYHKLTAVYYFLLLGVVASVYCVIMALRAAKTLIIGNSDPIKEFETEKELLVEALSTDELNQALKLALDSEDYNYASIIRDELKCRK